MLPSPPFTDRPEASNAAESSGVWGVRLAPPWHSSRATGKLLHVLDKGLRSEFQALRHREVREKLIPEFLHCHAGANRQCCGLDNLARLWGHDLHTDKSPVACLRDQLDEPPTVGAVATVLCRPDLAWKISIGGAFFLGYYLVFMLALEWTAPGYIARVWNLGALSGVTIQAIPLEELLFALTFGLYWSGIYEHFQWKYPAQNKISL